MLYMKSQLRLSLGWKEAFHKLQGEIYKLAKGPDGKYIGTLELILDVVTRWSSTYLMLEHALKLRKVCINFMVIFQSLC